MQGTSVTGSKEYQPCSSAWSTSARAATRACSQPCAAAAGDDLLDLHSDPDHHRSVLTLVGEDAPRRGGSRWLSSASTSGPTPAPILGSAPSTWCRSCRSREPPSADAVDGPRPLRRMGRRPSSALPGFLYGPERTLPDVRRRAFAELAPDRGRATPHPTAGAVAVGARPLLVAYNVWLAEPISGWPAGRRATLRSPALRALGLRVGEQVQVSMNLVAPGRVGPADGLRRRRRRAPAGGRRRAGGAGAGGGAATRSTRARWDGARPGRRPHDRGPASAGAEARGSGGGRPARLRRARARWRRIRRRSRSLMPPQMPNFSPFGEGVLEAVLAHDAAPADLLGLPGGGAPLGEEQVGVDAEAVGVVLPGWSSSSSMARRGHAGLPPSVDGCGSVSPTLASH